MSEHPKDRHIIEGRSIYKTFKIGEQHTTVLRDVSIKVLRGEFMIIHGPSGSGKSTLLNCLIGLEPITRGEVWVNGRRLDSLVEDDRAQTRNMTFGVVYQQPIWVKSLTVVENVALPMMINGASKETSLQKAYSHLKEVGMSKYAKRKPTEMSGGEQTRVGIARSLINSPPVLVLDEPTGNLDTHTADQMLLLLQELNRHKGITILMVTHNSTYLPLASITVGIRDGQVVESKIADNPLAHRLHGLAQKKVEAVDEAQ